MDDKEKLDTEPLDKMAESIKTAISSDIPQELLNVPTSSYDMGARIVGNKITGFSILNPRTRS